MAGRRIGTSSEPGANRVRTGCEPGPNQVRTSPNRTQLDASGAIPVRIAFQLLGEAAPRELMSGAVGGYRSAMPARTTAEKCTARFSGRSALALSSSSSSSSSAIPLLMNEHPPLKCILVPDPGPKRLRTRCEPVPSQSVLPKERSRLGLVRILAKRAPCSCFEKTLFKPVPIRVPSSYRSLKGAPA